MAIKKKTTTKNELVVGGVLKSIDDKGFNLECDGEKVTLEFDVILEMFQDKEFKMGLVETVKDEEEI